MNGAKSQQQIADEMKAQIDAKIAENNEMIDKMEHKDELSNADQLQLEKDYDALVEQTPMLDGWKQYTNTVIEQQFDFMSLVFVGVTVIAAIIALAFFKKIKASKRAAKRRTEELVSANASVFEKELLSIKSDAVLEQMRLDAMLQTQKIEELERELSNK